MKKFFVILMLLVLLPLAFTVHADEQAKNTAQKPAGIEIGGKIYTRGQIVADFLRVAFSDRVWNDDLGDTAYEMMLEIHSHNTLGKYTPWLDGFFLRPHGLPKSGVINKWPENSIISIGIDWPTYGEYYQKTDHSLKSELTEQGVEQYFKAFEDNIVAAIPSLAKAAGRSVVLIDPKDPREGTKAYARIRVVPTEHLVDRHWLGNFMPFMYHPLDYETYLQGGVLFGPSAGYVYYGPAPAYERTGKKMDGYLLPEADNNLGLVICKIDPKTEPAVIKALISECVVRAMGLPEISKINPLSVLGTWRNNLTDHKQDIPTKPTPYDLYMVSLLYCPDIKSGMSRNEVIDVFKEKKKCMPPLPYEETP